MNDLAKRRNIGSSTAAARQRRVGLRWAWALGLLQLYGSTLLLAMDEKTGAGEGLIGAYYENPDFTRPILPPKLGEDATLAGNPPEVTDGSFSVRWTGLLQPTRSTALSFSFSLDDNGGARLWIDGALHIDAWDYERRRDPPSAVVSLCAGVWYDLRVDYRYRNPGGSSAAPFQLTWSHDDRGPSPIPRSHLFSTAPVSSETGTKPLYLRFEETFADSAQWSGSGVEVSVLEGVAALRNTGGQTNDKIERRQTAFIHVDLERSPILRIGFDKVTGGAEWALEVYKTSPKWSEARKIQVNTTAAGTIDYNLPERTATPESQGVGWAGKERLQILLYVVCRKDCPEDSRVLVSGIQIGGYEPPPKPSPEPYRLAARILSTALSSTRYRFSVEGMRVYEDGRFDHHSWSSASTTYEWDFGDGPTSEEAEPEHDFGNDRPHTVRVTVNDAPGSQVHALKTVGRQRRMYADYFVGYRSREYSGTSELWAWYASDLVRWPWSARPGDLYEDPDDSPEAGGPVRKRTISYYTPAIGYYDQWDPATVEYSVLLATLVGLDGFCFEYQDPTTAAADLMARFKPYALQYGLGMTVHWIPASACAWFPEKYPNRDAMVDMGKVVVEQVTNDYILPTGATFTPAGESEERPIWFLFSWDRNATHTGAGYVPETRLDEVRGEFGFDPDELEALRSHSLASTRTNPLFLGCSWSFVDTKWPWPRSSPRRPVRESGDEPRALGRSGRDDRFPTEKADFPMAGPLDGLYGWPAPALDEMVPNHVYYNAHCVVPQAKDRIGTVAQNLKHGRRGYDSQELSIAAGEFAVRAGTVFPGFDDPYNAAWNTGFRRYIPRNDDKGTTLEQTFKMLTDYRADIGLFATFADWAESTTLEPTVETGCETAVAAAEGIARWKTEGLTTVQKEDLGRLIDIVVEIHRLRRKSAFLAKAGCATTQLGQLTAAIDAIIPVLLAKRLPEVEEKLRDAKKTTEGLESQLGEKSSVVLEWSDFAQAAMRNADGDVGRTRPPGADSTADATPVPLTDSLTHRIEMGRDCFTATPDARQRLRNSVYTDGRITLEYKDDGVSWLAVRVNNTDGFPTNVDEWAEIVKLRKEDTGSWQKATADFVAASFDQRFADRPDLIIEPQGSMIYVEPFSHQAPDLGVTLWVRHAEAVGATQNYLVLVDTELGKEVFRLRSNGSAVEAAVELGNTELDTVSTGADVLKRNWWHHIAAVWNGAAGTLNLYVDGVCVAGQGRTFTGRLATNTNQLLIGTLQGGLEGHVSDVQVYTSPLTATQIAAVRQGGSDSGLAGRWSCERDPDTAPQVVTDTSGKGRHGTLYNGAAWDESVDGRPAVRLTGTGQGAQLRKVTIRLNTLPRPPDAAVKGQ